MQQEIKAPVVERRRLDRFFGEKRHVTFLSHDEGPVHVIRAFGLVEMNASGLFSDTLIAAIKAGHRAIVVELSGVRHMSRAGARGLVVAAKLMQAMRGEMRIAGASGGVLTLIRHLGHESFLKTDDTLADSVARLTRPHMAAPYTLNYRKDIA